MPIFIARSGGTRGQPCALRYHYDILYFLLNLFYHSKLKFILPKFGKQKHLNFASEMRDEEEGARTNRRWSSWSSLVVAGRRGRRLTKYRLCNLVSKESTR